MSNEPTLPALSTEELDRLGHTVIALAMELWVLHDRQRVMESRLEELGLDLQLDTATPPAGLAGLLDEEREAFVKKLIDTLSGREPATAPDTKDD